MESENPKGWIRWAILAGATILAIVGIVVVAMQFGAKDEKVAISEGETSQEVTQNGASQDEVVDDKPIVENVLDGENMQVGQTGGDLPKSGPEEWSFLVVISAGLAAYFLSLGVGAFFREKLS